MKKTAPVGICTYIWSCEQVADIASTCVKTKDVLWGLVSIQLYSNFTMSMHISFHYIEGCYKVHYGIKSYSAVNLIGCSELYATRTQIVNVMQ